MNMTFNRKNKGQSGTLRICLILARQKEKQTKQLAEQKKSVNIILWYYFSFMA